MNNFILVANKVDHVMGGYIPARDVVKKRIASKAWALYSNTPHKNEVKNGDRLFVYLAGNGERCFVAVATAGQVVGTKGYNAEGENALCNAPACVLTLIDCKWFSESIYISEIKDALSFIPKNNKKWGCVMQRGMKKIPPDDAKLILSKAHLR